MGGADRAGMLIPDFQPHSPRLITQLGGKAKPLKQPKKAPKGELDEEDLAFKEKQKAGMLMRLNIRSSHADPNRCESQG
jgi:hypothetical protein